jgi:catechol 2,3-dioxygenase-like lactoylglutathione lyase family enzyme
MSELPAFAIRVTDLSRSIAFYRDLIGFTLVEEEPEQDVARMLDTDGDPTLLAGPGASDLKPLLAERHFILKPGESIGFHGGELAARLANLLQRGVTDAHIDESRFGDKTLRLKDLDGYTLEFIAPTERSPEENLALYAQMPDELDAVLAGLSASDFELSKDGGSWSISYIVHHLADGELLYLNGMFPALAIPGKHTTPISLDGNDATVENLGYAHRPIEPSLALFRAVHGYFTELGQHIPDAWVRETVSEGERKTSFGELVAYSTRHSAEHIEEIFEIRRIHGK